MSTAFSNSFSVSSRALCPRSTEQLMPALEVRENRPPSGDLGELDPGDKPRDDELVAQAGSFRRLHLRIGSRPFEPVDLAHLAHDDELIAIGADRAVIVEAVGLLGIAADHVRRL